MSNQFPIAVIVFFIFYHLEYLVAQNSLTSETNERNYLSSFTCENGNDIDFIDVCDGVSNCEDGTDEKGCENEAILFFYVRHKVLKLPNKNCESDYKNCLQSYGYCNYDRFINYGGSYCTDNTLSYDTVNLTGIYLSNNNNNNDLFNVQIYKSMVNYDAWRIDFYESQMSRIEITSNGPQFDMFYIKDKNWWRQTTTRHGLWSRTKMIKENVTSPVIDWVTSNVYYISESRIKVCDQNLVICTSLQSAVIKNPILLTISSKQRLLFWIERKSTSLCYLFAYSLDKNSLSSPVRKDLKNPKWITIDSIQDRLYWLDGDNDNALKLFSSTFEGKNVKTKITLPGTPILHNMTFAVFDSIMYWPSKDQKEIMKCSVNNCELSTTIFLPVIVDTASDYYVYSRSELGYFNMIHRSLNSNKTTDACNVSLCSHLCLPESETEYQCYCQHSEKPLPSSNTSSGFCEDDTLIAVYKDNLYIVGLFDDNFISSPIIHKYKVNISSIAAVAYDSRKGNIIFTEKDQQKIYFWVPQSRQQILILDEGPGTINLLEFDNYANNLYWIDSRVWVIKAMNLDTQIKVNVLKGNSSYVPIQFTLIPSTGYMAVLFLKTNSSVTIEKISMDGRPYSRKVLFVDDENNDVENLSLYYMKETRSIFLLNRLTNEIRYLSDKDSEFRYLKNTNIVGRIESMAFLKSAIIYWSENSPVIRKTKINLLDFEMNSSLAQEIPIDHNSTDFDTMGNSVMKLLGIERQIVEPRFAKCLQNNGGCEKLCLVSRKYSKFTCSCPEGEELIGDTSCRKIMVERPNQLQGETDTAKATSNASLGTKLITGSYRDPSQAITRTSEKIENEFKNSTQNQDHKTEITCLNSSHADLTIKELPSTNCCSCVGSISYQDSSPVCAECQPSSSLVIHLFYSVMIATVAILAFVAGYIFQGKAPGNTSIRFGPENRLLEMSNINAESTV